MSVVDTKLQDLLGNSQIEDINIGKDLKISELEFKEKGLKKYSEKVKKQKISLLWMLNVEFFKMIKYCNGSLKKVD